MLAYVNNQLHFLSERTAISMEPTEEMLTFSLVPRNNYCYQVAFIREDCLREAWVIVDLQPTLLSPPAVYQRRNEHWIVL